MCGIVGYIGPSPAQDILLSGLKRLEYRGYDSAGIATLERGKIVTTKVAGKIASLIETTEKHRHSGKIGIGHTRWATHGPPNKKNAHPHVVGDVALVHNGIIENYEQLKEELIASGATFISDTDSEVLAALINFQTHDLPIEEALSQSLQRVKGTFGIVMMHTRTPDTLYVARRGSPLVIGLSESATLIASDPSALAGKVKRVLYLDEDEIAVCQADKVVVTDLAQLPLEKLEEELTLEVEALQKQGYEHFLLKEIMEQPMSVQATMRGRLVPDEGVSHLGGINLSDDELRGIERILITGCGTAAHAGLQSKYLLEKLLRLPVDVEVASEFRYRQPVLSQKTMALIISQSGETADTLAALKEIKRQGIHSLGIVNVVGSSIAREVDSGVYIHAGPEISVASTKAFTSQVVAVLLVGLHIARQRGMALKEGAKLISALKKLPSDIEKALELRPHIEKLAKQVAKGDNAFYIGRDDFYPIAQEGALKLKEISYIHAEGYPAGEMKHGPIALIDESFITVALAAKGPLLEKTLSNIAEVKARGGPMIVITNDISLKKQKNTLFMPTSSNWTAPLVMNVVLQLLAYYTAVARGTNVDQPRNLAKSVTVE